MSDELRQFIAKDKLKISLILLSLSLVFWVVLIYQVKPGTADQMMYANQPLPLIFFLILWLTMMSAMMLPSVAPMITTYSALSKQRNSHNHLLAPTWIFLLGYLISWGSFGVLAYVTTLVLPIVERNLPAFGTPHVLLMATVLLLAGVYQFTPLKNLCLAQCRRPLGFIMHHWKEGRLGVIRMGIDHGLYCIGCCWTLMAILVVMGMMNIAWMLLLALLIFIEKIDKRGIFVGKIVGAGFITAGLLIGFQSIF